MVLSKLVGKLLLDFVDVVVESSVTVVYPRLDNSSTGGLDNLKGHLCAQRSLNPKSFRKKAETFAEVVMNQSCCRIRLILLGN